MESNVVFGAGAPQRTAMPKGNNAPAEFLRIFAAGSELVTKAQAGPHSPDVISCARALTGSRAPQ